MAFVSNNQELDENKQQAPGQGPIAPGGVNQSVHLAPSSGMGSTTGAGGVSPVKGQGGQFATLQNYVDANQGRAAGLAGNITSGVNKQFNDLQDQNNSVISGLNSQVSSAYTPQDQGLLQQEAANPVSFASNPGNVASFQKQLNDQYTGPTSAEGAGNYQSQLAKVNQAISTGQNLTGSEAGRAQLLAQNEKTPTAGVTGLNSAILSKDPNAMNSITNAYQPFSNLTTQLSTGAQGVNQNIAKGQTDAQTAAKAANDAISGQVSGLQDTLNKNLATAGTNATAYQKSVADSNASAEKGIQDAITAFQTGVAKDSLGRPVIPSSDWGNIGMGAFGPGATFNSSLPTMGQVATPDQFALGNALQQLGGTNPLSGVSASSYNPLTSNPTIKDMTSPMVSPLEKFMQDYFAASSPSGAPQGSKFGAGSSTEANVLPFEQAFVQPQYQNLMTQLNKYYDASAPQGYSAVPLPDNGVKPQAGINWFKPVQ